MSITFRQTTDSRGTNKGSALSGSEYDNNVIELLNNGVETYKNISALRLSSPSSWANKTVVYVKGYHTEGDGGGGMFYWDASSVLSDNNGTVIQPTNTAVGRFIRVKNNSSISVKHFGAIGNGVTDDYQAFQDAVDSGCKYIYIPEGTYIINTTILLHDKPDVRFEGAGIECTKISTFSDLLFDTNRISYTNLPLQSEYAKNCMFLITQFNSENQSINSSQRRFYINNCSFDFSDSPTLRLPSVVASAGLSFSKFTNIQCNEVNSFYNAIELTNGKSRHFHIEFDNLRVQNSERPFLNGFTGLSTNFGTTFIVKNSSLGKTNFGWEFNGFNYSGLYDSSVDNQAQGAYALDIYKCNTFTVVNAGVETRYEKAGSGFGGGVIRCRESTVSLVGGFFVGGDRDGVGTGNISDYGVTDSLIVFDNSIADWILPNIDVKVDESAANYPLYLKNGSSITFSQGNSFGNLNNDFSANDTSSIIKVALDKSITVFRGGDIDDFYRLDKYITDYVDQSTLIPSSTAAVNLNTLSETNFYRVNQANASPSISDYQTEVNHPENNAFGVLKVKSFGIYIRQEFTHTNGNNYVRISANAGSTWTNWN